MDAVLHILAEPLASDNLWLVLVFITALVVMAGFKAMGGHLAEWRRRRLLSVVR
jgi:hypothetical protein